jgi:ParB/RepB/Spo0J family partition protein
MPAKKPTSFFPAAARPTTVKPSSTQPKPGASEQAEIEQAIHVLTPQTVSFQDIPLDRIRPNPFQARTDFGTEESEEEIEELAQSIREHTFVSVLFVRSDPTDDGYFQLAYGERRWRAARLAGLGAIPCRIATYSDEQMEDIGLIENMQRKALNPIDEALALQRKLNRINPKTGKLFSIRSLADHLGVKKHRIEEPLRLCDIPPDCADMVRKRPDTVRVAFEIAKLPTSELRKPLIDRVVAHEVNTKDVMYLVDQLIDEQQRGRAQAEVIQTKGENGSKSQGGLLLPSLSQGVVDTSKDKAAESEVKGAVLPATDQQQASSYPVERTPIPIPTSEQRSPSTASAEPPIVASVPVVPSVVSVPAHSTPSLDQRLQEKKVNEDSKAILATIKRWSVWAEQGTYDKGLLRDHVERWITELQNVNKLLQHAEE